MGNNADGEAIMFAYNRLIQRKEKRKILLVLSDGQPACGKPRIAEYTKAVIQKIESDKLIEIVGIGLLYASVDEFYKKHMMIDDASKIEEALLSLIHKQIIK